MAATWRITIDRNMSGDATDDAEFERRVIIVADSRYLIDEDIAAWVRAELDPQAAIYVAPSVVWHHFDLPGRLDMTDYPFHRAEMQTECCYQSVMTAGRHSTRCANYVPLATEPE